MAMSHCAASPQSARDSGDSGDSGDSTSVQCNAINKWWDLTGAGAGWSDQAHTVLFHPNSGSSGLVGWLDAVRYNNYKAIYQTGGAPDCAKNKGNVTRHEPPLLFDLTADPAESTPLDPSKSSVQAVIATITGLRAAALKSASVTFHSFANYAEVTADEPCCNKSNIAVGCRCHL